MNRQRKWVHKLDINTVLLRYQECANLSTEFIQLLILIEISKWNVYPPPLCVGEFAKITPKLVYIFIYKDSSKSSKKMIMLVV